MEPHVASNVIVAILVAGGVLAFLAARRSELWRDAGRSLVRRRPIALALIGLYVLVALLDSVSWIGGGEDEVGGSTLALHAEISAGMSSR